MADRKLYMEVNTPISRMAKPCFPAELRNDRANRF